MDQTGAPPRPAERIELGPRSQLWRWAGDSRIAFMGGAIGLLQLMHPAIGAGVLEHSNFFENPADRVFRSLPSILGAVYDADAAATGAAVRHVHCTIKGTDPAGRTYHALDPRTFWWAHATFQFMAEQVADRFDRRGLSSSGREQLYREGVEWYRRYGVSDRVVPPDRAAFQMEWDRVCAEELEMNDAVQFVLEQLRRPLPPMDGRVGVPRRLQSVINMKAVRAVVAQPSRVVAIGGLPVIVRRRFDIHWTRRDQRELELIEDVVARTWRVLPARYRWQPRALQGWRRTTGRAP